MLFIFVFSTNSKDLLNNSCWWLDSKPGPLESEATALSTLPQPLTSKKKCLRSFKDDRGQWLWISRYLERLWYRRAAVRIQSLSVFIYYQLYGKDKIEASNSQKLSILYYLGYISLAQSFHFHGKFYKFQLSSCWYHFERSGWQIQTRRSPFQLYCRPPSAK